VRPGVGDDHDQSRDVRGSTVLRDEQVRRVAGGLARLLVLHDRTHTASESETFGAALALAAVAVAIGPGPATVAHRRLLVVGSLASTWPPSMLAALGIDVNGAFVGLRAWLPARRSRSRWYHVAVTRIRSSSGRDFPRSRPGGEIYPTSWVL
jgi:hypothetical protein